MVSKLPAAWYVQIGALNLVIYLSQNTFAAFTLSSNDKDRRKVRSHKMFWPFQTTPPPHSYQVFALKVRQL